MPRPKWPTPDDSSLTSEVRDWDEAARADRVGRYRFVLEEFGPPADMLLFGGFPALLAIHELQRAFVMGNYLGTILVAQVFVEHSLAGGYRLTGKDKIVEAGLATLIDQSLADDTITESIAARLHELRRMRNPYTHPHAGMSERSYMARLRDRGPEPFAMAERDAMEAIRIVVDFLRASSPSWVPAGGTRA